MLAFVPPNRLSIYSIDRVFAHELVHAVLNDYIHQSQLPVWFHEGCCELIHGAAHRLRNVMAYTSTNDLMKLIDPWGANSPAYAAAYVAVLWLHELSGGIEQIIARIMADRP
jgi:flagellin